MNFPDNSRIAEQKRVHKVDQIITQQLNDITSQLQSAQKERQQVEKNYGSNTRANYIEADDILETYATTQQQKQLLSSAVSNEEILSNKQRNLKTLSGSPYFGRIDITENSENDTLYIGVASLSNNDDFLVYDWRAPIAAIYYNGNLGAVKYATPDGQQTVKLNRKRQFSISNGQINNMFDTNETIGDEILKNALGQASSAQMKNIVATIQRTQNQIIRDTTADVLIVQGAAGSGKTSTIMQRIAYLLYHSRQNLKSEQIILFSPNHLFSSYIAKVLPSLGERNMRQITLNDLLTHRLEGLQVQTLFARFEQDQAQMDNTTKIIQQYKESTDFVKVLNNFRTTKQTPTFNNLYFEGEIIFSKQEITDIYEQLPHNLLASDKYLQTKNKLIQNLKRHIKQQAETDWLAQELDNISDDVYEKAIIANKLADAPLMQQQKALTNYYLKQHYLPLYDAIYNDHFLNIYQTYTKVLTKSKPAEIADLSWNEMILEIQDELEKHYLHLDDATAILFLRNLITGKGQNHQIKYLFIDEMQDYSYMQLAYIHQSFPDAKLTLVGDIEQNVYASKSLPSNHFQNLANLFNKKKTTLLTLNQSYRATASITKFASQFVHTDSQIQAFNRTGMLPQVIQTNDLINTTQKIAKKLVKHQRTVAIITKTKQQAEALNQQLIIPHILLQETTLKIPKGLVILPVYLAKGLEFDAVLGYSINKTNYQTSRDQGILYTIATRAMHELYLISDNNLTNFIKNINSSTYNLVTI
ncbi:RNA polymerase recycling motor HelD [Bombilactobacillus thymidiniphilus]|uniref:AAA family ATPase n=1 Tax=Bombilactobacillus thymidiniphilus TaxID=2923363 RepID=A0ABY4PEJ9_9LACO|nr:RNA polymerase recycling motor HelD [Bombilactobacillus thymidiniphilus]UQS84062.1 AAA family ATPase [Bombilactobacillus thymidiniphilus]